MSTFEIYAENLSDKGPPLLKELRLETENITSKANMLSSEYQGRLLSFISKIKKPKNILEIGTFTGYSAICLSEGLCEDGKLYTIEKNESYLEIATKYFFKFELSAKIISLYGNAEEVIERLDKKFDIIFIDANKKSYKLYYDLVLPKLEKDGLIIVDNVWWKGKVMDKMPKDNLTKSMKTFNEYIFNDKRVKKLFLPIRDGLYILSKV